MYNLDEPITLFLIRAWKKKKLKDTKYDVTNNLIYLGLLAVATYYDTLHFLITTFLNYDYIKPNTIYKVIVYGNNIRKNDQTSAIT